MADPRTSRFWLASIQSGLLDVSSLTACWEGIPPEKRHVLEHLDRRLARQAVQQNHLTLWQAQQLLAGRTSGFQVDRYLLLDLIGHGGMGRVYLARDTRLNRSVALKILAPERMSNPRAIARFQREARVGAQLQHENLVRIYDFGESNGRFFLVMEYIEGKTIGTLIGQQGAIPARTAAWLARQVALGLEHAHRKGLIHRDVNPYNVLVTHDGIAKLADLGLAIDLADEERVTREGATVGTFDYVAPEQARHSHSADIRSDIYSLGCTLYHMIAGQVPFPSPSLPEKLFAHQALEPTPLGEIIADVPPELVEVVSRMMRKQPEERYPTPLHVAQALEPFIGDQVRPREGRAEADVLIPNEVPERPEPQPIGAGNGEPEEISPIVLEPVPETVSQLSDQPPQPVVKVPHSQSPAAPVLTPLADDGANASPAASFISPFDTGNVHSNDGVPLFLDLGPEPSLSEALSRSKSRSDVEGSEKKQRLPTFPTPAQISQAIAGLKMLSGPARRPLLIGIVATIVLFVFLAIVYSSAHRGKQDQPKETSSTHKVIRNSKSSGKHAPSGGTRSPISVVGNDGEIQSAKNLVEALRMAVGAEGWVELSNAEPLTLAAIPEQMTSPTNSWFKIRSAPGVEAALVVVMKGQKPFLTLGSDTNLVVQGLKIIIDYTGRKEGKEAAPVIETAGEARLSNCHFQVKGNTGVPGSGAILMDGGNLTVEDCCFQGLDAVVEFHASGGSKAKLRNTIIIGSTQPSARGSAPDKADFAGWAMKVERYPGGRSDTRQLILDHCTVVGEGLLRLKGFAPSSSLQVDISACAIQSKTLIGWVPNPAETKWNPRTVGWLDAGNQLEVTGPFWVVPVEKPATGGAAERIDREKWLNLVKPHELIPGPVEFLGQPETHPESIEPKDFEVKQTTRKKVGADPARVGPGGLRETAKTNRAK
ncbi:MAG: protein kinase domain-containing protein [Isosphaeraceae bacterium]